MRILIPFICLLLFSQGYTQDFSKSCKILYKAEYVDFKGQDNQNGEKSAQVKDIIKRYKDNYSKINLELLFSKERSLFRSIDALERDNDMYFKLASQKVTGGKIYYINLKNNEKIFYVDFQGEKITVDISQEKYKWEITPESKIISGFKCFKATTTKIIKGSLYTPESNLLIEVWFTPDLQGSFGPFGYDGLPGVILSVFSNNIHVFATEIICDLDTDIKKPKGDIEFKSEDEFDREIMKKFNNFKNFKK